ncbi:zinc finger, PMZ-type containing protein [Tanacetum coccineum]
MAEFMRIGYENNKHMELFTEHHGYDVLEYTANDNLVANNISDYEESNVSDYDGESDPENVDFHTEGEQGVHFERLSIDDPFLTKLVGNGNFIGARSDPMPFLIGNYNVEEDDPEVDIIDPIYKVVKGKSYPVYDPEECWKENKPVLGMRYANPEELKHALAKENKPVLGMPRKKRVRHPEMGVKDMENGIKAAASSTIKPEFLTKMEDIRRFDHEAHAYLMKREHASWCKAFFQPALNVCPSGYQVLEVRKRDEAYGVNLIERSCFCKLWDLSGIPCVHAVAAYMHLHMDPELGVCDWYTQSKWHDAYQFSIKPVFGSKMWKASPNTPPLPPIIQKMPGRPRKKRVRHPTENDYEGGGSVVRGGGSNIERGGGNVGRGGGSSNKRGGGSVGRGGGSVGRGGGSSSKRGGGSVGRGGGSNIGRGGRSNMGRGGGSTTSRGSGSSSKRGGGSNSKRGGMKRGFSSSFNTEDERQLALDEEAAREVFAEVNAAREQEMLEIERNGRVYQDWDDVQWNDDFRNDHDITTLKCPTISELEAVDEAHDEYLNNMDSITTGAQAPAQTAIIHLISADNVSNNEQPRIHLTPEVPDTSSQSSRVVLNPRPRSERIAKRRKLADGTADKPFTL